MFECPKCKNVFNEQTCYCLDWRIKELSFGCPYCKTLYKVKKFRTSIPDNLKASYRMVVLNIYLWIFGVPLLLVFFDEDFLSKIFLLIFLIHMYLLVGAYVFFPYGTNIEKLEPIESIEKNYE